MRISAIAARLLALTGLLAIAACAAAPPAPAPLAAAKGAATVLAVRPIVAGADQGGAWRSVLLDGAPGPAQPPNAGLAEVIVREDAGPTISIVQSNAAGLHAGDRVVVTHPAAASGRASLIRLL